jgi:hypothetical protein
MQEPLFSLCPVSSNEGESEPVWLYLSVFWISASTLAFEIVLSRLFAVTQFYHFAFMTVSLALLGIGASGTALSVFPSLRQSDPARRLSLFALLTALSALGSFTLANRLPFDSFAIAWEGRQVLYLALMYLALATPFFFSALAVGWLFSTRPADAARIYTANLTGSSIGCLLALGALATLGGESAATFCAWLAGVGAIMAGIAGVASRRAHRTQISLGDMVLGLLGISVTGLLTIWLFSLPSFLEIRLSPYKSLSQVLRPPGAERVWTRWDAASRVDLVQSPSIRSFPGMSYAYLGELPRQDGLTFDGDALSPITYADAGTAEFAGYMPGSLPYLLQPTARALVLGTRGGLDVVVALASGAGDVTAVEPSEIAVEAVKLATDLDDNSKVRFVIDEPRSFVRRSGQTFDVVQLALTHPYRPVTSGAYSLAENYDLTVEGFQDALSRLNEDGLFVITRWLQTPPSEGPRLFALAVTAAEQAGLDPTQSIIALRGYNTVTVIVKRGSWGDEELNAVREFAAARKFDLIYTPGLRAEEANRYNVLKDDAFYRIFQELVTHPDRRQFYGDYPFDVKPPTDDWPFFGHYFKWSQAGEILAQLGKTWQPFGGAGYYVLVMLLAFAVVAAGIIIILPLAIQGGVRRTAYTGAALAYFAMIGLGFLFIEIPLVQRLILFVGRPTYALAVVLFGLLMFCGLGSLVSSLVPWRAALGVLVVTSLIYPLLLPALFEATLGLPLAARFALGVLSLAPLGLLMGMPLPKGIAWLEKVAPDLIPWAWGVNGAVSVIASVLAALVALTVGLRVVLVAGAVCYALALVATSPFAAVRRQSNND